MECVGALSWNGAGWGAAMARYDARDAARKRPQIQQHSAGAVAATPASRAGRAEVRPLEQDWSQYRPPLHGRRFGRMG